jgi:hypothetical protein
VTLVAAMFASAHAEVRQAVKKLSPTSLSVPLRVFF